MCGQGYSVLPVVPHKPEQALECRSPGVLAVDILPAVQAVGIRLEEPPVGGKLPAGVAGLAVYIQVVAQVPDILLLAGQPAVWLLWHVEQPLVVV